MKRRLVALFVVIALILNLIFTGASAVGFAEDRNSDNFDGRNQTSSLI